MVFDLRDDDSWCCLAHIRSRVDFDGVETAANDESVADYAVSFAALQGHGACQTKAADYKSSLVEDRIASIYLSCPDIEEPEG